jgi:hypothetical protein
MPIILKPSIDYCSEGKQYLESGWVADTFLDPPAIHPNQSR